MKRKELLFIKEQKTQRVPASGFFLRRFLRKVAYSFWLVAYFLLSNHLLMQLAITPATTEDRNVKILFI